MDIHPIRSEEAHAAALRRIESLWSSAPNTPESDELEILVDLVEHYEDRHFPLAGADPIDLLRAHMEATGRGQADLAELLGSRPRASEVLGRRRALTVGMIYRISREWGLPADALVAPYVLAA